MPKTDPIEITKQHWSPDAKPLVSVCNWVYNHKDYIKQSIDSILMQKTTFPVEIIIQDDASNDGTREIIEEYVIRYPHLFNNILFEENQYSQGKDITIGLFKKASGKYIALAHGDDYWTDPYKLQKQVDFLEGNECISGTFHNVEQRWEGIDKSAIYLKENKYTCSQVVELKDIIGNNIVPTCSLVFRKQVFMLSQSKIPWEKLDYGDWVIIVLLTLNNTIYYSPSIMGVRRMNESSLWGMKDFNWQIEKIINTRNIISSLDLLPSNGKEMLEVYNFELLLKYHNIQAPRFLIFVKNILKFIIRNIDNLKDKYILIKLQSRIRNEKKK